ncbi:MAG: class I SAM-dependent methyltransferase [Candidatus Aureabacteria bacterium]|nr:class I SAM-dependent methyltransferase [Candidatus Auribacterota bacterium]
MIDSTLDLNKFSAALTCRDGIWFSPSASPVSYPHEIRDLIFQIEDSSFWFRHRNCCIGEAIRNYPPAGVLLELGGGNGCVSKYLQDNQIGVVLLEPDIAGIRNARERGVKNLICSTYKDARFNGHSLPAIGLFDVLEHIEDDLGFLRDVKNTLMPGGRVYITSPAHNFLWADADDYGKHFRRYALGSLSSILGKAGFEAEYGTYLFSLLPTPILLLRALPYAIGIRGRWSVERARKEYMHDRGLAQSLLRYFGHLECALIKHRKRIPFGSSCLVIGRAVSA